MTMRKNAEVNVLITSSSRKVALANAFKSALKSQCKGKVFVSDASPLSASLYKYPNSVVSKRSDDPGYLSWLNDFCSKHKVNLIIPTRDEELLFFARIKDGFLKKGIYINISAAKTVETCNDKIKFYEFCQKNGFKTPELFKEAQGIKFPCFLKSRYGKGSRMSFKINSHAQLKALLPFVEEYIIQEFIALREYTVDYFADFQGKPVAAVPRQRLSTYSGESFIGKTVKDKFLIEAVIRLASSLGLLGHNTIQLFYDPQSKKIVFSEINPRVGGGAALGIAAGANTPLFMIKSVLKEPIKYGLYDFQDGLYMLRYTEDVFIKENDLIPSTKSPGSNPGDRNL